MEKPGVIKSRMQTITITEIWWLSFKGFVSIQTPSDYQNRNKRW